MLARRLVRLRCGSIRVPAGLAATRPGPSPSPSRQLSSPRSPNNNNTNNNHDDDADPNKRIIKNVHWRIRSAQPLVSHNLATRFTQAGRGRTSRAFVIATVLAAVAFYIYNLQTVPMTGRRRFNFLPAGLVAWLYSGAAQDVARQEVKRGGRFLGKDDPRSRAVLRVMERLVPVCGMSSGDWKITMVQSGTINAFMLPGSEMFVHTGMIDMCQSEDELAAVLGHEIAHRAAMHHEERLSAAYVGNLAAGSLFFLAGALPGLALFGLWNLMGGFYLRDLLWSLPMGRKQEAEADYMGLMMMAEACYDPRAAVELWSRLEALQDAMGHEVPEMLSSHPSFGHRVANFQGWMGEALRKYGESGCRATSSLREQFWDALRFNQMMVPTLQRRGV